MEWKIVVEQKSIPASKMAMCICDMWDQHWSRGATERVGQLAPKINQLINRARDLGIQIIHAPSETLSFYENSPARNRMRFQNKNEMKKVVKQFKSFKSRSYPLPIDDSDGGSDTPHLDKYRANTMVWRRQIPDIIIDESCDGISDSGPEIYSFLKDRGNEYYFLMGVHTNMCVLNRTFGIKAMRHTDLHVGFIRDLTDAMYNPAKRPYVSHEEGTRLVCDYIEKFYCPTLLSSNFV
jgi:nicotinamidase-related amidase